MNKTFQEVIAGIRTAIYGREVREDIAQGMEYVETFAATATQKASAAADSATKAEQAAQRAEDAATAASTIIDDTVIADSKTWSSKGIVDTLCPPIQATGNPVVCYPVPGYPLGTTVSFAPIQEGEGDPSPENIRPIKARESVTVERCGKNLLKNKGNKTINGIEWTFDDQGLISIKGTIGQNLSDYFFWGGTVENAEAFTTHVDLVLSSNYITNNPNCIFGARTDAGLLQNGGKLEHVSIPSGTRIYGVFMRVLNATVDYSGIYAQLELGTTAPTTFAPYTGQTATLTLPRTIYGGTVDAVTGEGQETWKLLTLDGTEPWEDNGNIASRKEQQWALYGILGPYPGTFGISSHFDNIKGSQVYPFNFVRISANSLVFHVALDGPFATSDALKSYLAAQYAAGTPVQIAYKLATPTPITATGGKPIPALAGTNTLLTDGGSLTVTGRADPTHEIQQLRAAVVALGGTI